MIKDIIPIFEHLSDKANFSFEEKNNQIIISKTPVKFIYQLDEDPQYPNFIILTEKAYISDLNPNSYKTYIFWKEYLDQKFFEPYKKEIIYKDFFTSFNLKNLDDPNIQQFLKTDFLTQFPLEYISKIKARQAKQKLKGVQSLLSNRFHLTLNNKKFISISNDKNIVNFELVDPDTNFLIREYNSKNPLWLFDIDMSHIKNLEFITNIGDGKSFIGRYLDLFLSFSSDRDILFRIKSDEGKEFGFLYPKHSSDMNPALYSYQKNLSEKDIEIIQKSLIAENINFIGSRIADLYRNLDKNAFNILKKEGFNFEVIPKNIDMLDRMLFQSIENFFSIQTFNVEGLFHVKQFQETFKQLSKVLKKFQAQKAPIQPVYSLNITINQKTDPNNVINFMNQFLNVLEDSDIQEFFNHTVQKIIEKSNNKPISILDISILEGKILPSFKINDKFLSDSLLLQYYFQKKGENFILDIKGKYGEHLLYLNNQKLMFIKEGNILKLFLQKSTFIPKIEIC